MSLTKEIQQLHSLLTAERLKRLEHLACSFVYETGLSPQEVELVEEDHGTWRRWFYRRREGAQRLTESAMPTTPATFWLCLFGMRDALADVETRTAIEAELRIAPRAREMVRDLAALIEALPVEIPE